MAASSFPYHWIISHYNVACASFSLPLSWTFLRSEEKDKTSENSISSLCDTCLGGYTRQELKGGLSRGPHL